MRHIPIAYATTDDYEVVVVSLTSLLLSAKEETFYDIHFLVDESFTDRSRAGLKTICHFYKSRCDVFFHDVGSFFDDLPMEIAHITKQTYYRLLLPNIIEEDRCIYLDWDTIVCVDLQELFGLNMEENLIAGVKGPLYYRMKEDEEYCKAFCEQALLPSIDQYINAGVLLMNLNMLRKDRVVEKFIELLPCHMRTQDQDILNSACYGRITFLPFEYNVMTKYADWCISEYNGLFTEEELRRAWNSPKIIHYADIIKPWKNFDCPLGDYWWNICKKSHVWEYFYRKQEKEFFARTVYCSKKANAVFTTKRVFKEFNLLSKKKLVIYGAGKRAVEVITKMSEQGIKPEYILVSEKQKNPTMIKEIEVRELSDIKNIGRDRTIIVATLERYHTEIISLLQDYDYREIIPLSDGWKYEEEMQ